MENSVDINYAIKVEDLVIKYGDFTALEGISFKLPPKNVLTIVGPNGAGKTTLLKALLGLLKPSRGKVLILGKDPYKNKKEIRKFVAYVPQRDNINTSVPLKARDVVLYALLMKKGPLSMPTKKDIKKVREALKTVNLPKEAWNKAFNELSGGQQQKVLIARAIVLNPKILILDEPFNGVDVASQKEIMKFLDKMKKEKGATIVMVLHDINPFVEYIDYVLMINRNVMAFGKIADVMTEDKLFKIYKTKVKIIRHGDVCFALVGDYHA